MIETQTETDFDAMETAAKTEPQEITRGEFLRMLNTLPPVTWINRIDSESFKLSEPMAGCVGRIYARISVPVGDGEIEDRYFSFSDHLLTPHAQIIARCQAVPRGPNDDDELLDEERCEAHEGEERSDRCPDKWTRMVREPFTPGRFKIRCCEEHARGLIRNGYTPAAFCHAGAG